MCLAVSTHTESSIAREVCAATLEAILNQYFPCADIVCSSKRIAGVSWLNRSTSLTAGSCSRGSNR